MLLEVFQRAELKSPKQVATTRQLIKSKYGFGWSISSWERNNKLITKVVYRYQNGSRNSILVDLNWSSDNSDKMINLVLELAKSNKIQEIWCMKLSLR